MTKSSANIQVCACAAPCQVCRCQQSEQSQEHIEHIRAALSRFAERRQGGRR